MGPQNIVQDWVTECMCTHTHVIEVIRISRIFLEILRIWLHFDVETVGFENRASEQNCHAWFWQRMELPFFAKTIGAAHFRWKFRNPVWYTKSRIFKWRCREINPLCAFEKLVRMVIFICNRWSLFAADLEKVRSLFINDLKIFSNFPLSTSI